MTDTLLEIWNKILTSNLFNFVLMLILLGWIIDKFKLGDVLEAGRKSIEDKIVSSKQNRINAVKELFETQENGVKVEQEALEIREKSADNAVIVGEKLVEDAKKESENYSKNIQKNIDSNIEKLRMNLTNETAQLAINKAKNHIENELKKDRTLHIRYINESIDALKEIDL